MLHKHTLTIDSELMDVVRNRARANHRSINKEISFLIECALIVEEAKDIEVMRLAHRAAKDLHPEHTEMAAP